MLCATCLEKGEIPCPRCRRPMPAGCGKKCWTCYWTEVAVKRTQMDQAAFRVPGMAKRFADFGAWLIQRVGEHRAALTVHKYLAFFLDIEREWQDVPDYEALLKHFSAAGLRRSRLPMLWMKESGLVTPDATLREADSDRRRIQASLDKLPQESPERSILNGYHERLMKQARTGATSLRSVRLAIAPAASLLIFAEATDCMPADQKTLDGFLRHTPGQRAALSGFVKYLREQHGAEITLPKSDPDRAYRKRRKNLEAEILKLMREGRTDPESKQRWLCVALAYFHDLPLKTEQNVRDEDITADEHGMTMRVAGSGYWIPRLDSGGRA